MGGCCSSGDKYDEIPTISRSDSCPSAANVPLRISPGDFETLVNRLKTANSDQERISIINAMTHYKYSLHDINKMLSTISKNQEKIKAMRILKKCTMDGEPNNGCLLKQFHENYT